MVGKVDVGRCRERRKIDSAAYSRRFLFQAKGACLYRFVYALIPAVRECCDVPWRQPVPFSTQYDFVGRRFNQRERLPPLARLSSGIPLACYAGGIDTISNLVRVLGV